MDLGFAGDQHRFEVHRHWVQPQALEEAPAVKALGRKPGLCHRQAEMLQYQHILPQEMREKTFKEML